MLLHKLLRFIPLTRRANSRSPDPPALSRRPLPDWSGILQYIQDFNFQPSVNLDGVRIAVSAKNAAPARQTQNYTNSRIFHSKNANRPGPERKTALQTQPDHVPVRGRHYHYLQKRLIHAQHQDSPNPQKLP